MMRAVLLSHGGVIGTAAALALFWWK